MEIIIIITNISQWGRALPEVYSLREDMLSVGKKGYSLKYMLSGEEGILPEVYSQWVRGDTP